MPDRLVAPLALDAFPHPHPFRTPDARYQGTNAGVALSAFGAASEAVQTVYDALQDIHRRLTPVMGEVRQGEVQGIVGAFANGPTWSAARHCAMSLGDNLDRSTMDVRAKQALHDLRGGALAGLVIQLDLFLEGLVRGAAIDRIFLLARDHMKIMRNAVFDLDPEGYAADLQTKHHPVELLRKKWDHADYQVGKRAVMVRMHSDWDGPIAERCMEFAALDRVLYNLVNNAARFALVDDQVEISLRPRASAQGTQLCLAVANRITESHAHGLREAHGGDGLGQLFAGGFTTGGNGMGMRIASEFIARGYGLRGFHDAVSEHYVGARMVENVFVAWFHWPAV